MIFQWCIIFLQTVKVVVELFIEETYDIRLLISILIVDLSLSFVFMFALCKISGIAKKHGIELNSCYMIMHFIFIWILVINWAGDSIFFYNANKYDIHEESQWVELSACERITVNRILYWKAVFDCIPSEFLLDLIVLILVRRFAMDCST